MTQDDTTALTWFHQWLLLVVFYCSDSAWSSHSSYSSGWVKGNSTASDVREAVCTLTDSLILILLLVSTTWSDNIFLSMCRRSSLLHLHDLIFKTSNVCIGFSWGLAHATATLQLHLQCKSLEIVETCGNSVKAAAVVFENTAPCQPSSRSQEGSLRLPANQSHLECHGAIMCHCSLASLESFKSM